MVFFRLLGPFQASYGEITFGRWRLRQERETTLTSKQPSAMTFSTSNWIQCKNSENLTWMVTDLDRWVFPLTISSPNFSFIPPTVSEKIDAEVTIQLSQYDQCQTRRPKEFKECMPFQIYQSAQGCGFEPQQSATGSQAIKHRNSVFYCFVCIKSIS